MTSLFCCVTNDLMRTGHEMSVDVEVNFPAVMWPVVQTSFRSQCGVCVFASNQTDSNYSVYIELQERQ